MPPATVRPVSSFQPGTPAPAGRGAERFDVMNSQDIRPGTWIDYADTENYRGARVPCGRRCAMVVEVRGARVRVVTNSPRPAVKWIRADEVVAELRPVLVKECDARLHYCREYGLPNGTRATLRTVRDAARGARKKD